MDTRRALSAAGEGGTAGLRGARCESGYGAEWTVEALDRVLREETPRIGLWLDTTGQTVEQTVDTVLAELGRARVVGAGES
ncbi:hypothetical protein [Streptomyces sp. NBC_00057]|uniref:hypothetical protein n=1 Tax=Streptomyces sp. NBC_00057 TaxID=2975634 RepID=UPI003864D77D